MLIGESTRGSRRGTRPPPPPDAPADFADLAGDARFGMIDAKYIQMEAENLRRVKKMLDKMVSEGTDISMAAMDKMLDGKGAPTLKDKKGSSAKDLFGDDPF